MMAFQRPDRSETMSILSCSVEINGLTRFIPLQLLQDVENRLVTLSEKITMCDKVMNDLKHLKDVLVVSFFLFLDPCDWDDFETYLWLCLTEEISAGCCLTTTELKN